MFETLKICQPGIPVCILNGGDVGVPEGVVDKPHHQARLTNSLKIFTNLVIPLITINKSHVYLSLLFNFAAAQPKNHCGCFCYHCGCYKIAYIFKIDQGLSRAL